MPVIDATLVLEATNNALAKLDPVGHIASLDADDNSNQGWSCNFFAPTLLDYAQKASSGGHCHHGIWGKWASLAHGFSGKQPGEFLHAVYKIVGEP